MFVKCAYIIPQLFNTKITTFCIVMHLIGLKPDVPLFIYNNKETYGLINYSYFGAILLDIELNGG